MAKLKLGALADDRPVRVTLDLPGPLHRMLTAYAAALARETGQPVGEPVKLIAPMIERFMASDRGFVRTQRDPTPPS